MKKILFVIGLIMPISHLVAGQEQPPVTFPPGYNVCDPTPYKLVFDEEFNGNSVDYSKWVTWGTWNGDESDTWGDGARFDWQRGQTIIRDKNVIIGGGIARLQVYHELQYWNCNSCLSAHTTNYSSGRLCTRYSQHYNNGKFEARLKYPKADHMWSTMWTYHGNANGGINEIDMGEASGGPLTIFGQNNFMISHSTHVQPPNNTTPNPYNLPQRDKTTHYPHEDWWDIVNGTFFDMDHWHTYSCEWDTALLSHYLDGSLIYQEPKYYYNQPIPVYQHFLFFSRQSGSINVYHPAICNTDPWKLYHVNTVFPYNNFSESILNFTTQMDADLTPKAPGTPPLTGSTLVGELAIDYVHIWQRHPEKDGHVDLCGPSTGVFLSGPNLVCSTANYTVTSNFSVPPGNWTLSSNLTIIAQTSTSNTKTITVQRNPNSTSSYGTITYTTSIPGCPSGVGYKQIDVGPPKQYAANIVRTLMYGGTDCFYDLFATNPYPNTTYGLSNSPTTYLWDVWYGSNDTYGALNNLNFANHLVATGQHISTSIVPVGSQFGGLQGTLTITNGCGSIVIPIQKLNMFAKGVANTEPETGNANYFDAEITDTAAFRLAVEQDIQGQFVPDTLVEDTSAVRQIVEKAITRALAPYLLIDTNTVKERSKSFAASTAQNDATKIFPNPTTGAIYVLLGTQFDLSAATIISINDLYGRELRAAELLPDANGTLHTSIQDFAPGLYSISIKQARVVRQFLITRQ